MFSAILSVLYFHLVLASATTSKPNIVIIIADDMGFNDVGFHGSDVKTPNIDALAGNGIILNRHYTQPCCTPSRAALMTSKYPFKMGMQGLPIKAGTTNGLPLNEKLFPQYFKELGYRTHLIGKWHLGYETWEHTPTRRGFDHFYGLYNGIVGYYDGVSSQQWPDGMHNGWDFRRNETGAWSEVCGQYLTDVLTGEAVRVIEKHQDYGGLLLFINHLAVHTGNLGFYRDMPPNMSNHSGRAILAEMAKKLDDSVGQVVEALNNKGILNNTIIVFMSDNGGPTNDPIWGFRNYASNWPFRGEKVSVHEGGVRTTALVWSPMISKPKVSEQYFHITDWLPTLYSAVGGRSDAFSDIDGIDQWKSLINSNESLRYEIVIELDGYRNTEAIINGHWKLVKNFGSFPESVLDIYSGTSGRDEPYDADGVRNSLVNRILMKPAAYFDGVRKRATVTAYRPTTANISQECRTRHCLFDIERDPVECEDLAEEFPSVVSYLRHRLEEHRKLLVPKKPEIFDPRSDPLLWNDYWSPWLRSGSDINKSGLILIAIATVLTTITF